nr:MAG TPA: hypothetical protein [Caudoviricetes sp.]
MTELKTAAEIRQMIADKREAVRTNINLDPVYEKINEDLQNIPLGAIFIRVSAKEIRQYIGMPDEEWKDSVGHVLDAIRYTLEKAGYIIKPIYGLSFSASPSRTGLFVYWDENDLPKEE